MMLVNGRFVYICCFYFLTSYLVSILLNSSYHPYHLTEDILSKMTNALVARSNGKNFSSNFFLFICSTWHWSTAFTLWHDILLVFLLLFQSPPEAPFSACFFTVDVLQDSAFGLLTPCNSLCDFFHSHGFNSHLHKIHSRSRCLIQISAPRSFFPLHIFTMIHRQLKLSVSEPK